MNCWVFKIIYELKMRYPIPPIWININRISWPKNEKVEPISTHTSPVVEMAETTVKRLSMDVTGQLVERGSCKSSQPNTTEAKYPNKNFAEMGFQRVTGASIFWKRS